MKKKQINLAELPLPAAFAGADVPIIGKSASVHVPLEHQSSPKETDANRAIRNAAQDLFDGKWIPENSDDFWDNGLSGILVQHPAVQEALSRLEYETQTKTNAEYLEKAEELHEINEMLSSRAKWDGQGRWMGNYNEEARKVNPMTPTEFIKKLQSIPGVSAEWDPPTRLTRVENPDYNPFEIVQEAQQYIDLHVVKSDKKIYLGNRVILNRVALNAKVRSLENDEIEERRINTLQVPYGPEWTVMRFDEYGIPVNEKFHGWRTALLSLITNRVITVRQAHKAFGEPQGEASLFYKQQIFEGGY